MFFMPGCIADFGKHIPETVLLLEKVDIQWAEIKAKIAEVNQTEYVTLYVFGRLPGKLHDFCFNTAA